MSRGQHRTGQRRTAWAATALFLAVWLNMAVQPCLMASEPLLPASHESGDCPHCPPPDHCGDTGRCAFIDGFDFDARQPALPEPDPVGFAARVAPPPAAPAPPPVALRPPDPAALDPGPPRYLELCRLLN